MCDNYMTAEECKQRLWKDTGRTGFHVFLDSEQLSEAEYLDILNYIKRKINICELNRKKERA